MIIARIPTQKVLVLFTSFLLSSCVGAVQMFPTSTPTLGPTIEPTQTPTMIPTRTPTSTPTRTPTLEPTPTEIPAFTKIFTPTPTAGAILRLGTSRNIDEGGFSFQPIIGYEETVQEKRVTLISNDGDTVLSFIGGQKTNTADLASILESFAEILSESENFSIEFNPELSFSVTIDTSPGLAAEVAGFWGEYPIAGRIVVVAPSEGVLFYALAFSSNDLSGDGWEPQGRQAFEAVIQSINFFDPVDSQ